MRPKELAQILLRQAEDASQDYPEWMRRQWREAASEFERLTDVSCLPSTVLTDDGGLEQPQPYLSWSPGEEHAQLSGRFTAAELRAIATHMEAPRFAPYA